MMPDVKLAYIVIAHKNPRQLLRLLRAIQSPLTSAIVIHVDRKSEPAMHEAAAQWAADNSNSRVIPAQNVIWGNWRVAHAQMRCLAEALSFSKDWDYCLSLSGQDYPLKTQRQITSQLAAGPSGANYIEVLDFDKASPKARRRMEYYWFPWRGQMTRILRRRRWPRFKLYWGSNHINLTRAGCAHLAHSDLARRMERTFRFTTCSDEMIFQNALMHGPADLRDSIVSNCRRKLTWSGGSHPKTYTIDDLKDLLASDAWFARKFDETIDSRILDALDKHLR